MKETVLRMLTADVAQPMITIADSEKQAIGNALLDLKDFKCIERLTRGVVNDCINQEVARSVYETTIEKNVLRDILE